MVFVVHWYLGKLRFFDALRWLVGLPQWISPDAAADGGARKKAKNICRIFWKQTSSSFILCIILRLHFIFHSRHLVGIFAILAALHNLPHWLTHWSGVRKGGYMEVRGALRKIFWVWLGFCRSVGFQIFERFSDSWKIFGKFSDFWKNFQFLENFLIFGKFFRFLESFQIFGKFSDFWKIY